MTDEPRTTVDAAAQRLASWLGLAWDGLHDRDIIAEWPDWVFGGDGHKHMQGGKPALRRIAREMIEAQNGQ